MHQESRDLVEKQVIIRHAVPEGSLANEALQLLTRFPRILPRIPSASSSGGAPDREEQHDNEEHQGGQSLARSTLSS